MCPGTQNMAALGLTMAPGAVNAISSKWIHETYSDAGAFAWQSGDAAFTISRSAAAKVAAYIENQKEHHRVRTFDDEYKAFLDRHDIEYDDRFVFG